jgi:hypothetical protein
MLHFIGILKNDNLARDYHRGIMDVQVQKVKSIVASGAHSPDGVLSTEYVD